MRTTKLSRGTYAVRLGGRRVILHRRTETVWGITSGTTGELLSVRIGLQLAYRRARSILRLQRREEEAYAKRNQPKPPSLI